MLDYIERRDIFTSNLFPEPSKAVKSGRGFVNTLINANPVELHPFNYSYLGPSTHYDLRREKGVKPINELDRLAMNHDDAYSKSNDMKDRHDADYRLQEGAWNRFLDPKASLGERGMAYVTSNTMKLKRLIGAGLPTQKQKKQKKKGLPRTLNTP